MSTPKSEAWVDTSGSPAVSNPKSEAWVDTSGSPACQTHKPWTDSQPSHHRMRPKPHTEESTRIAKPEPIRFPQPKRLQRLRNQFPGTTGEAIERLKTAPMVRSDVQKPLRGSWVGGQLVMSSCSSGSTTITSGARLWYCPDPASRIVCLTLAASGHPRATVSKSKRGSRNR